ncbi:GNAT family N-acetyltransferase [Myxococcota bacterium]|nr:GNAT family N-acetyltransferase [Myxococcota bacterium]
MDYLIPPERVETPGFVLRSYEVNDGPLLAEATNASYEHLRAFMPWARPHSTEADAERDARRFRGRWLLSQDFTIAIVSPDGRRLLGGTGFHPRNDSLAARRVEIGMWIRADEAGRGLGSAVLRVMLRWGFSAWPWEELIWRAAVNNVASQRTALAVGMEEEHDDPEGMRRFRALRGSWPGSTPSFEGEVTR